MTTQAGEIEIIIPPREARIDAFSVRRTLPAARRRMVGPFTFLDHIGPLPAAQGRLEVLPHPHIGIATLTYIIEGELVHRDTLGNTQVLRPREVNWMTSGSGIAHSERASRSFEGTMNAVQAWVALPAEAEETDPSFFHADADELPAFSDSGVAGQLLSGEAYGLASAVKSHSPLFYAGARLARGATVPLPREHAERAVYVVRGAVTHGDRTHEAGHLVVFRPGGEPAVTATTDAEILLLGGEPVGKRFMWWNFVSSRKERIDQAKADWAAGRIPLPPDDREEFVPLPHDSWPKPKPEPMS